MTVSTEPEFPVRDLGLSAGPPGLLHGATRAVTAELNRAGKPHHVHVRAVSNLPDAPTLFRLEVNDGSALDWTWEGARVVAWGEVDPLDRGDDGGDHWVGEVVAVDSDSATLLVLTRGATPRPGLALAYPYAFLAALAVVLDRPEVAGPLAANLAAATGSAQGAPLAPTSEAVPALGSAWHSSWGVLWGPPGTGKTQTIATQVVAALVDPTERVLVVSSTNRATDEVAMRIGQIAAEAGLDLHGILRLGSGANLAPFAAAGLSELLAGGESELRWRRSAVRRARERSLDAEARARLAAEDRALGLALREAPGLFTARARRVVVTTAFGAEQRLEDDATVGPLLAAGRAPFTTLIVDEAGLIARVRVAALALLAGRRVLLVGDPLQLAPIAALEKVLPREEAQWLASSALSALTLRDAARPDVTLLTRQHRMAPDIRVVVSAYQYGGRLLDAPGVADRPPPFGEPFASGPRALWWVLDAEAKEGLELHAERGPGGRSWTRPSSLRCLLRLLAAHPDLAGGNGIFVSPFRAQVAAARAALDREDRAGWSASTVHAQQGTEADIVVFDTVHAGSGAWDSAEWNRLINVGLSRARHLLVVIAAREEMAAPFLLPLAPHLKAVRMGKDGLMEAVPGAMEHEAPPTPPERPGSLGAQLAARRGQRPRLTQEQVRLVAMRLDGGPRLVRGVAGSGKTLVLARWLARTVARFDGAHTALVVFANAALEGLLREQIADAWRHEAPLLPLPEDRFQLVPLRKVLDQLRSEAGLPRCRGYDYEAQAAETLAALGSAGPRVRYEAVFVDEAQDFGPAALQLVAALAEPDPMDGRRRPVLVFFDNAQNVYGRGTPRWSELGLDMQGRSVVMKEAFRCTRPISELALNTLARLRPLHEDPDHRELLRRRLVVAEDRDGASFLSVLTCPISGPIPSVTWYARRSLEMEALAEQVARWVGPEGVRPGDIRVLCNSADVRRVAVSALRAALLPLGARVEEQARQAFSRRDDLLIVTTPHSFKGYEAEIVVVPGVDRFVDSAGRAEPLASALYVAMTRARTLLWVSGLDAPRGVGSRAVVEAVRRSASLLTES